MPLLLVAVPLQKSWLGLSYWRTPTIMELPVELEYIPYQEFQDRFSKLNQIVRPIYPTIWPNILMVSIFAAMIVTAAIGMARNVSGLAVMGQVACFVIPILAILWIRIRKESKARARKQFKKQSIKLLREWTEQDTPTFAIQWKLRLRVWNDVRRRREAAAAAAASGGVEQAQEQEREQEVDLVQQQHGQQMQSSVAIQIEPLDTNNEAIGSTTNGVETMPPDTLTTSIQPPPPRVADVYTALGLPTPANYISNNSTTSLPSPPPLIATTTPSRSRMRTSSQQQQRPLHQPTPTNNDSTQLTSDPTLFETRQSWIERLRDLSSRLLFTETRVWMIEISRRDNGVMDEYALTVPSPVYCGYRLPGYEDVLLQGTGGDGVTGETEEARGGGVNSVGEMAISIGVSASTTTVNNNNNAQQQQQMRYGGPPPAYFSDSEGEDDDDDEDEEGGGLQQQSTSATSTTATTATTGPEELTGVVTLSGAHQPHHQRPMEMTAVALTSGPTSTSVLTSTIVGDRITGRLGNHSHHRHQQGSTMSGSTMTSSSMSTCSATTSRTTLALTLVDKDKEDNNGAGGEGGEGERDDEDHNKAAMDKETK